MLQQHRTKEQAELKLRQLLVTHGLGNYSVEFPGRTNHKTAIANCNRGEQKINFVLFYALHLKDFDFEQIALHEIAHALTPGHGHDSHFRNVCRRIGAIEKATSKIHYISVEDLPEHLKAKVNLIYECPNGHTLKRTRKLTARTSCGQCSRRFDERYLFQLKEKVY